MRIIWKTDPRGDYYEVDVPDGMTLEGQYRRKSKHFAYVPLMAKVNGIYRDLCTVPENGDIVEMLDMRSQPACYVYQNSLTLMFIAAVKQVMPYANVHVDNSLNQGLYINLIDDDGDQIQPDEAVITEIDTVMREMVENDEPIERDKYPKDEAIRIMREDEKLPVMATVLEKAPPNETIKLYKLRGMTHCAYTQIVPSCGYLQIFQLMPYKDAIILRYPNTRHPGELPPYIDQYKLYDAFKFQKSWDELTGINYSIDMKRYTKDKAYKKLILLSEALHEKRIAEIADRIKREKKRIILIAGPSSSGKTTFAKRLLIQLMVNGADPLYMGTDDYFVERDQTPLDEHGEPNYEGFNALDVELFNSNMNDLLAGKEVDLPTFNFLTGKKEYGKRITSVGENQPIIIEGIHALNAALTEKIPQKEKFKIYISPLTQINIDEHNRVPTSDERMLRRLVRDNLYRGHDASETLHNWPKVRAGEDVNIFPFHSEADVLFNSFHVYEISVLKKYADPLLAKVSVDDPVYMEALRMRMFLGFFDEIDDDTYIPVNSIIREFIGGSIFVD